MRNTPRSETTAVFDQPSFNPFCRRATSAGGTTSPLRNISTSQVRDNQNFGGIFPCFSTRFLDIHIMYSYMLYSPPEWICWIYNRYSDIFQIFYKTSSRAPRNTKLFMTKKLLATPDNTGPIGHESHETAAFSDLVGSHLVGSPQLWQLWHLRGWNNAWSKFLEKFSISENLSLLRHFWFHTPILPWKSINQSPGEAPPLIQKQ